jgi:hypothetical protein
MLQSPSRRDSSVAKSLRRFVSSGWVECKSGANIKALALCLARSPPGRAPIIRRRPVCACDSIVGHGRPRKQAHDEYHDWIRIRLGFCNICGKAITFLPMFSLPYTHYSLIARSEALRRYFVDGCSCEAAAPPVKDPRRVADPSTLRRWFQDMDSTQPPFSFLQRMILKIDRWMGRLEILHHDDLLLSWPIVLPFLRRFWPLRT